MSASSLSEVRRAPLRLARRTVKVRPAHPSSLRDLRDRRELRVCGLSGGFMRRLVTCAVGVLLVITGVSAQPAAPDLILSNGKIVTVDERFTIAQAVAVRGERSEERRVGKERR